MDFPPIPVLHVTPEAARAVSPAEYAAVGVHLLTGVLHILDCLTEITEARREGDEDTDDLLARLLNPDPGRDALDQGLATVEAKLHALREIV